MNTTTFLMKSAVVSAILLAAASAHAQYRCDTPATSVDRRACEAAKESPQALRQFIQRMQPVQSLQFSDYVNEATLSAWEARERAQQVAKSSEKPAAGSRP